MSGYDAMKIVVKKSSTASPALLPEPTASQSGLFNTSGHLKTVSCFPRSPLVNSTLSMARNPFLSRGKLFSSFHLGIYISPNSGTKSVDPGVKIEMSETSLLADDIIADAAVINSPNVNVSWHYLH